MCISQTVVLLFFVFCIRLWSNENPNWIVGSKDQSSEKVMVWLGIIDAKLIGPFFFEDNVNGNNYLTMLNGLVIPKLEQLGLIDCYFQQDGAPPHFSRNVKNYLNERFPNKWIGRGGPVEWAPRSPDLTVLDFFAWGFIKNEVYQTAIHNKEHLIVGSKIKNKTFL